MFPEEMNRVRSLLHLKELTVFVRQGALRLLKNLEFWKVHV